MNNTLKIRSSRCFTALFASLYIFIVLIGIGTGLLVLRPFVHINVYDDTTKTVGTWYIKSDGADKIITGTEFDLSISLYNTSIFPLTFKPHKAFFSYYPIGSSVECLKCLYIDQAPKSIDSKNRTYIIHKPVVPDTTDGLIDLNNLVVSVPPKTSQSDVFTIQIPVKGYFEISNDESEVLNSLKPMLMDCKKHKAILLSMRVEDVTNKLGFITTKVPAVYEIFIPLQCELSGNLDNISHDSFDNGVILAGVVNNKEKSIKI